MRWTLLSFVEMSLGIPDEGKLFVGWFRPVLICSEYLSDLFGIPNSLANFLFERQGNPVKFIGCSKC